MHSHSLSGVEAHSLEDLPDILACRAPPTDKKQTLCCLLSDLRKAVPGARKAFQTAQNYVVGLAEASWRCQAHRPAKFLRKRGSQSRRNPHRYRKQFRSASPSHQAGAGHGWHVSTAEGSGTDDADHETTAENDAGLHVHSPS